MYVLMALKLLPLKIKNSQANAICEWWQKSISISLQNMFHRYLPENIDQINNIMDTCFATAICASKMAIRVRI